MNKILVVTHDGFFHADDVMTCALINFMHNGNIRLIRTRDESIIKDANYVVDVGGVYNPKKNRFDHHQENCNVTYSKKYKYPMSSVGMFFKEHGEKIINKINEGNLNNETLKKVKEWIYCYFIYELDCKDNGVEYKESTYKISTDLSSTLQKYNTFNAYDYEAQFNRFFHAMEYALCTFKMHVINYIDRTKKVIEDDKMIINGMEKRFSEHKSGELLVLDKYCPNLIYCLRNYENKNPYLNPHRNIKFIIFPSGNGKWKIQAMCGSEKNSIRKKLKNEKELCTLNRTLLNKIVFIHKNRFTGATYDKPSAIHVAGLSLV